MLKLKCRRHGTTRVPLDSICAILDARSSLDAGMRPDREPAEQALRTSGKRLGLDPHATVDAILRVATADI